MADEQLKVFVDVVTNRAVSELKKLKRATEDTGEELEDTRTEAQKVADRIDAVTRSMVDDMMAAEKAADALAQALGPEMADKIGRAGIAEFVSDLKRAGLAATDVEGDAERLAQTLKGIDEAKAPLRDVETHMRAVGRETDNSRSVMANFTGNALQELPLMSGAMGPLNTAIGQFAEYAVDGNIKLANFLKTAGGIGIAALAFSKLNEEAERNRRINEINAGQAEGYADALAEGAAQTEAIKEQLRAAGGLELAAEGLLGKFVNGDVIDALAATGITVDQFARYVAAGEAGLVDLRYELQRTNQTGEDGYKVFLFAQQQIENYAEGLDTATDRSAFFADGTEELIAIQEVVEQTIEDTANEVRSLIQAMTDAIKKHRELAGLLWGVEEAQLATASAYDELTVKTAEWGDGAGDNAEELRNLRQEQINVAQSVVDLSLKQLEAKGINADSVEGVQTQITELKRLQEQYPLVKGEIQKYIDELLRIPGTVNTNLTINGRTFGASEVTGPGGSSMTPTNPTNPNANPGGTTIIVNGALDPVAVADQIDRIMSANRYRNGDG